MELTKDTKEADTGIKDPVLAMRSVGKRLWAEESGDAFVDRLRSEDPLRCFVAECD